MTSTAITRPVRTTDAPSTAATFAPIPFSRLLRVEWGKATDTRAARWLLALCAASTVGLILAPILSPASIDQTYTSYLGWAAIGVTILLPVLSILTLTSEWSQRTALTTFTQEPRRTRVINAKVAVSLLLAGGGAGFGAVVTVAGLALASALGRELDANLNAGVVIGYLLFVLLNVLTGIVFGALLQNPAAAIVLYFGLPIGFALLGRAVTSVAEWIDTTTTFNWVLLGQWSGHAPQILFSIALWVAVPLAAGLVRTVRREIR
jgi:ABC-type transport system involved in multi-copper enzyme maturation permease subunit